jgi:hypothetical protein
MPAARAAAALSRAARAAASGLAPGSASQAQRHSK